MLLGFKLWKLIRDSSSRQMTMSTSVLLSETEAVTDGQCPPYIACGHVFLWAPIQHLYSIMITSVAKTV